MPTITPNMMMPMNMNSITNMTQWNPAVSIQTPGFTGGVGTDPTGGLGAGFGLGTNGASPVSMGADLAQISSGLQGVYNVSNPLGADQGLLSGVLGPVYNTIVGVSQSLSQILGDIPQLLNSYYTEYLPQKQAQVEAQQKEAEAKKKADAEKKAATDKTETKDTEAKKENSDDDKSKETKKA